MNAKGNLILMLLLCAMMLPAVVQAQFIFTTNSDGSLNLYQYAGSDGDVVIPSLTNGLPVSTIQNAAFYGCTSVTNITIGSSVTGNVAQAFVGCPHLLAVNVDTNNPSYSSLDGVLFDKSLTTFISYPEGRGGSYVIPDGVTGIGNFAFDHCENLTSVTIPSSVTNYGWNAFFNCTNLLVVYFRGMAPTDYYPGGPSVFWLVNNATLYYVQENTRWASKFDGLQTVQWDPEVLNQLIYTNTGGRVAITGYTGSNGAVTIPITINGLPVTSIESNAFLNCTSLTSVNIPSSVTNLGSEAFKNCYNLKGVYFQGNAPVADSTVFSGDNNVTNYYLPRRTTGWGSTFAGRPVTPLLFDYVTCNGTLTIVSLTLPSGHVNIPSTINGLLVIGIGDNAFRDMSLTNVTIPESITNIGSQAFSACVQLSMINVDIANTFYSSVDGVLFNKNQTKLIRYPGGLSGSYAIPSSVTYIGDFAFYLCVNLTDITIPDSVTCIGDYTFNYCTRLMSVTIPCSVTSIGEYAFSNCSSLNSVTIPASVTSIGIWAFYYSGSLINAYFQGNAPVVDGSVFQYTPATVYYLPGTTGWDAFAVNSGRPTALWLLPNPLILNNSPSFGVQTNGFGFTIFWATNIPVIVESCTNLANPVWSPVGTNILAGGTSYFSDPLWTNYPSRYYRLRSP